MDGIFGLREEKEKKEREGGWAGSPALRLLAGLI